MKKVYIAPNIRFSANGSLEGVFASLDQCGNTRSFKTIDSGQRNVMNTYPNNANTWILQLNDSDLDEE